MRTLILTGLTALTLEGCSTDADVVQNGPTVTATDFEPLVGDNWTGELTYLDYGSDKRVSIPTAATVKLAGPNAIKYTVSYPEEPWEDTKSTLKITHSGRVFDGHVITVRQIAADGKLVLRTEYQGEDNNQPADIRMTYRVGSKSFSIEKDVRFSADQEFMNRNVYAFSRP